MRLIRFGESGREHPGVLDSDNRRLDVSAFGEDWNEDFFGSDGLARFEKWLTEHSAACPIVAGTPNVMKAAFTRENDYFAERSIDYVDGAVNLAEPNFLKLQMFEKVTCFAAGRFKPFFRLIPDIRVSCHRSEGHLA